MKDFLPQLLATFTGPREEVRAGVSFQWSKHSWTHNVFRTYELIFGRRKGARNEFSYRAISKNEVVITFHTWEAFIAHVIEGSVRRFLRTFKLGFRIVKVPQLALANGGTMDSPYRYAMAFGTASSTYTGSGNPTITVALTLSGTNGMLMGMWSGAGNGAGDPFVSTTWNGTAMNSNTSTSAGGSSGIFARGVWLPSPANGSFNMVWTQSGGQYTLWPVGSFYTGASQSTPDDYQAQSTASGSGSTITSTTTTATTGCWCVQFAGAGNGTASAGTNLTLRTPAAPFGGGSGSAGDSNGTVAGGSFSLTTGGLATGFQWAIMYKFAELVAPFKTWNGVLEANIKTINGLS